MTVQFYPAFIGRESRDYRVRVAGFADVEARGMTVNAAVARAKSALERRLSGRSSPRAWPVALTTLRPSDGEVTTLIAIELPNKSPSAGCGASAA